jgi:hypothetical protein
MVNDIGLLIIRYVGIEEFAKVGSTCKSYANAMRCIAEDGKLFDADVIPNKDARFERAVQKKCKKIAMLLLKAGVSQKAIDRALQSALEDHDQEVFNYIVSKDLVSQNVIDKAFNNLTRTSYFLPYISQFKLLLTKVTQGAYEQAFMRLAARADASTWFSVADVRTWFGRIFEQSSNSYHLFTAAIKENNIGAFSLLVKEVDAAEGSVGVTKKLKLVIDSWTMPYTKLEAVELVLKCKPNLKPKQLNKFLKRAMCCNKPDVETIKALVKSNMLSHQDVIVAKKMLSSIQ